MTYTIKRISRAKQTEDVTSFSGGSPLLPERFSWSMCGDCGQPLTFYFQISFPPGHPWHGRTMAVFFCVDRITKETAHPYPLSHDRSDSSFSREEHVAYLDNAVVEDPPRNYRLLVFGADEPKALRREHPPRVKYQVIQLNSSERDPGLRTKVGGACVGTDGWVRDFGRRYRGHDLVFLMQLGREYSFPRLADAPPQQMDPYDQSWVKTEPSYLLFTGYPLCFFGTPIDIEEPLIYLGG